MLPFSSATPRRTIRDPQAVGSDRRDSVIQKLGRHLQIGAEARTAVGERNPQLVARAGELDVDR